MYLALTHVCMWREKSWKRISAYAQLEAMMPWNENVIKLCKLDN